MADESTFLKLGILDAELGVVHAYDGDSSRLQDEAFRGPSEAQIRLQSLLDKQLSVSTGRPEQVEFTSSAANAHVVGFGSSGMTSLASFKQKKAAQTQAEDRRWREEQNLRSLGVSEGTIAAILQSDTPSGGPQESGDTRGRKRKVLEAHPDRQRLLREEEEALLEEKTARHQLQGKDSLQAGVHAGSAARKPFPEEVERALKRGTAAPLDHAREGKEEPRPAGDAFADAAPPVLDLATFLQDHAPALGAAGEEAAFTATDSAQAVESAASANETERASKEREGSGLGGVLQGASLPLGLIPGTAGPVKPLPLEDVASARLDIEEVKRLPGGKFAKYAAGVPSKSLYLKNLSPEVAEVDLVRLFIRFQRDPTAKLVFRLFKKGRLKNQAFVRFPDEATAAEAMTFANGYLLLGRPLVISFGKA